MLFEQTTYPDLNYFTFVNTYELLKHEPVQKSRGRVVVKEKI